MIGKKLSHYTILDRLGAGACGRASTRSDAAESPRVGHAGRQPHAAKTIRFTDVRVSYGTDRYEIGGRH